MPFGYDACVWLFNHGLTLVVQESSCASAPDLCWVNLQQLEYLVAVAETGQFVEAANRCHVTQATLSAMLKKLEEELGLRLIDRSRQPVKPTPAGEALIKQAAQVLHQAKQMKMLAEELLGSTAGDYRMLIIPTLSSSFLPLFLPRMLQPQANWTLDLKETFTAEMLQQLKQGEADMGILAGPIVEPGLLEIPLFEEAFYLMASADLHEKVSKPLSLGHLPDAPFWLLEEGHCLRNQMLALCNHVQRQPGFTYQAGNTETLMRLVHSHGGMTLVPALQLQGLSEAYQASMLAFEAPMPVRSISLVVREDYPRRRFLELVVACAREAVAGLEGVWFAGESVNTRVIPIR